MALIDGGMPFSVSFSIYKAGGKQSFSMPLYKACFLMSILTFIYMFMLLHGPKL
jgi:hypothetical protein